MGAWYYKQDDEVYGLYSEEAMVELINNGSVTFVTMVRDLNTEEGGEEWHYAYETSLASYFSDENKAETPPEQPAAGPEKKPRKMPLIVLFFLVLFIIGLIIGTVSWIFTH